VGTPTRTKKRFRWSAVMTAAVLGIVFAIAGAAFADDISNNLDASVDAVAEAMPLTVGGANGTTRLYVVPQNGDGKNGCNLTGSTTASISLASSNTSVATVSPSTVTFTSCVTSTTGPVVTVTPVGAGTATISATLTSNNTGGSFNVAPVTFAVNVAPPPNTPPHVSVSGVTGGASYNKGSVPAATCNVTDAEDGNSSFPATLSAISGQYASDGIGQQTASCSYTDGGGLTATDSLTYNIVDPSAPSIGYTLNPASPNGTNGWYNSNVSLTWSVGEPQSPNSLEKTGCVNQNITADQAATMYSCSATSAGGSAGPVDVTIKRDAHAPDLDCGTLPSGWQADNVTLDCTASDSPSGLANAADGTFQLGTNVASGSEDATAATGSKTVGDNAGNSETAGPYSFMVDRKDPTYSCGSPPSGWSGSDVSIHCTASDGGSGLAHASDASFNLSTSVAAGSETDNSSTDSREVCDNVGHCVTAGPFSGIKVDKKAPSVNCGSADGDWHASDVSIHCTASDGGSDLADASDASFDLSTNVANGTETANASTNSHDVLDAVGNSATAGPIGGNMIDKKDPNVSCDSADGNWHADNVSIGCTASDGGSGLADSADAAFSLSTTVPAGTENGNASTGSHVVVDGVGHSVTAGPITGNKIDRKAPSVDCGSADGSWHAGNVSIVCTASDGGSGLASAGDATFNLSTSVPAGTETANASTDSHVVADDVGNSATAGPISGNKIDRKGPVVTLTCPTNALVLNSTASASWSATDGGSGVTAGFASGSVGLDTSSIGTHTANLAAGASKDNVDNSSAATSCSYSVIWNFHGFFQPIDNNGVYNVVKAGSAIPVKFDLSGNMGLSIFAANYPVSAKIPCNATSPQDAIEETLTAGGSSLSYDATTNLPYGQYIYVWKTDKAWGGTCRQLQVKLADGTTKTANFNFTR
jgi:hypothetical protein